MKPPVEHVKVSSKGKDIMIKLKRHTGLEHWHEICRIALCYSLSMKSLPSNDLKPADSSIAIEWKTFGGQFQHELTAIFLIKAKKDKIDLSDKDALSEYFRAHIERGIASLNTIKSLPDLMGILSSPGNNQTA